MFNLFSFQIIMAIIPAVAIPAPLLSTINESLGTDTHQELASVSSEPLVARQKSEDTPWLQRIFRRTPGGTSRGPDDLCVISPYGEVRYSWSRSPLFVWFDQQNSVKRIELLASDGSAPIWTFYPQNSQNPQGLYQVAYDGSQLTADKDFYFQMYETVEPEGIDNPIYTIPLALMLDEAYTEVQTQLNDLEQGLIGGDENELLSAKVEFLRIKAIPEQVALSILQRLQGILEHKGYF